MESTDERTKLYYDRIAAGYEQMVETAANHAVRECFWREAESRLPEAGSILDFGAGSGIDAQHFAALGHDVIAYDPSEGMIAELRRKCAADIEAGCVSILCGNLDEVRGALTDRAPFDAILCNFAVFSSMRSLAPALDLFAQVTRPGSAVLITIQNPWYPPDMRTAAFWKALLAMPFRPVLSYDSDELGRSYRHTRAQVRKAARPFFAPDDRPAADCRARRFGWRSPFNLVVLRRT